MKSKVILFLLLLSLSHMLSFAQDGRVDQLDSIFAALYNSGKFSGSVLIAENGKPLYQKSFGVANEQSQQPLDINSMYLLGSVSKQFTAFGIVLLKEQGKLSYEDDLQKYLPLLPYKNITIRHLLTHTSGIPDYISLMNNYWDRSKIASNQDMVNMLVQYHPPVLFEPGAKYEYSNTGYGLLALVIEKASGLSFGKFMEEKVFGPLGMTRTLVYTRRYQPRPVTDYALGYVYNDSLHRYSLPDEDPKSRTTLWEDGIVGLDGINSTVGDLLRWDGLLYKNPLLPASSLEDIFTPAKVQTGETDYGFGWHIKSLPAYGKVAYHSGGWPGYIAYIERHMDNHKTIIILRNRFTPEIRMPIDKIRSILYGQQLSATASIDIPDNILDKYTGEYQISNEFNITIRKNGTRLNVQGTNQPTRPMEPVTPNKFYVKGPDATIEFVKDGKGDINKLILYQHNQSVEATKK